MKFEGINHVALVVTDLERSRKFFREVLGMPEHPKISRWFCAGACAIHLIENKDAGVDKSPYRATQHVAIQVDDRHELVSRLIKAGVEPFQWTMEGVRSALTSADDSLTWGTQTVLTHDPDGNLLEFIEMGVGLFESEPNPFA